MLLRISIGHLRGLAETLDPVSGKQFAPVSITVDHRTEFTSRALDEWAYRRGLKLGVICPGKPSENGHLESFNGKLRDECLNANQFLSSDDARSKIEAWRTDYSLRRPHSSLGHLTPNEYKKTARRSD